MNCTRCNHLRSHENHHNNALPGYHRFIEPEDTSTSDVLDTMTTVLATEVAMGVFDSSPSVDTSSSSFGGSDFGGFGGRDSGGGGASGSW